MKKYHLLLAALVATCWSQSQLHAQLDFEFQPTGSANYNVGSNWDFFGLQQVPAGSSNQRSFIQNGGTAQVSDTPVAPGSVLLGGAVNSGHLEILSGGNLATDDSGANVDGSIIVGNDGGDGTLSVLPGGTLAPVGPLTVNAGANNSATFGAAAGAGTANVTVPAATFSGNLTAFGNSNFLSNGNFTLAASNAYMAEISGGSAPTLQAIGTANLGGSLSANFAGAPAPGSSWTLVDAGTIAGDFSSFNSNITLPAGQAFSFSTVSGGNGQQLNLSLSEVLTLEVNRNSGIATIKQAAGASGSIDIDGYSILSSEGSLITGGWNSLADQGALGGGWTESNPTANALSELKAIGAGSLAPGQSAAVGSVYDPFAVPFGFTGEDLTFEYTTVSGQTFNGVVELTGTLVNNIVLQIDPTTGEGRIRNSSGTTLAIDAYTVESASGSLDAANWNSLDDQNAAGGEWLELFNPANDNMIGEVEPGSGTTTGPAGEAILDIGQVFDIAGSRDLVFQYKEAGALSASLGAVVYAEITNVPGDLNFDGSVSGIDFLFAQRAADPSSAIATWSANYPLNGGALQAATAVPEPAAGTIALLVLGLSMLYRGGTSRV